MGRLPARVRGLKANPEADVRLTGGAVQCPPRSVAGMAEIQSGLAVAAERCGFVCRVRLKPLGR